ncbi:MAG: hypothetical protein IRY95_05950 [Clostridia bacterium]|nr:hypothetical protein [Clostridia bacterium]
MSRAEKLEVTGDVWEVQDWFIRQGWSDGLPVVPPTEELVARLVAASGRDPEERLGEMPPAWNAVTVEKVAVNAVMAGCRPAHFPVVLAAVEALLDPAFNLYGVQATTHPVAPLLLVNGPVAREIGVNGEAGAFGPGFPANAVIGRAVRLVLMNIGGGYPGRGDRSTQGSPAKFSYCIAENAAANPWGEYHTSLGFAADESVVSVFPAEAPHNVNDHESSSGRRFLDIVADVMSALGHNNWYISYNGRNEMLVVLGPEHAAMLKEEGWTREDVQYYLYHRSARAAADLRRGGMWGMKDWARWQTALAEDDGGRVPPVRHPEDVVVLVAGGPGKHSCVIPTFGAARHVVRRVRKPAA